jgi:phosphoglycolate phosphatase
MLEHIKAVIIDLDGTLLDTAADIHAAINHMRADLGLAPADAGFVRDSIGKGTEALVRKVLAIDLDADAISARFEGAHTAYLRHYARTNGEFATLYPGVIDGLEAMKAKDLRLACVTNKPYSLAKDLLKKTGLSSYFEVVYGGDSLSKKKPHPLPMQKACEALDASPEQTVAIGDSSNDAEAARAAGCWVLTVPYGYNHGQPVQEIESDGIVETLLHAANLIQN